MAKKVDGVIEAARYKNGKIEVVRVFERRGASFSDWILVPRHELMKRLKDGKNFMTGTRTEFLAGTFETSKPVRVVSRDGKEFISTHDSAEQDELEQVPFF